MGLKQFFSRVESMSTEEVKDFIQQHEEGTYTLLDVRQPKEYKEEHLPGSKLIPLSQLNDSLSEIDPEKPTIVYCAIGGRSRVAAQLLSGKGFKNIYNMKGGIKAWKGLKASGPHELNLDLIKGDETPFEIIAIAYELEKGLEKFYQLATEKASDPQVIEILSDLANFEVMHQEKLISLYLSHNPDDLALKRFKYQLIPKVMEGGFDIEIFLKQNASFLKETKGLLTLAMMLETQALDLYLRFAEKSTQKSTKDILFKIATEEKNHLATLARIYDQKI